MDVLRTPDDRFDDLPDFPYEPNYVEVDDGDGGSLRIHYVDEGEADAPLVLLMHGEPSWAYLYRKMIPHFVDAGYRCVAPDLPGFGRSDKPAEREDYTYARYVDWMGQFADEAGLDFIHLVCQDWGGLIGLRLVAAVPERFEKVVAANTFLPTGEEEMTEPFFLWRQLSQSMEQFDAGQVLQMGTIRELSDEVVDAYRAPFPDESYCSGARMLPMLVPTSTDDPEHEANVEAWDALREFEKPFLTVFGDSDPIMRGVEKIFQREIPGAKDQHHQILEDTGHFIQEDSGPELAWAAIDFFDEE
jgi:haloalkane dehalogenase